MSDVGDEMNIAATHWLAGVRHQVPAATSNRLRRRRQPQAAAVQPGLYTGPWPLVVVCSPAHAMQTWRYRPRIRIKPRQARLHMLSIARFLQCRPATHAYGRQQPMVRVQLALCNHGAQEAYHLERALRFQMAGRAAVQGPSIACLYRPYSCSFACKRGIIQGVVRQWCSQCRVKRTPCSATRHNQTGWTRPASSLSEPTSGSVGTMRIQPSHLVVETGVATQRSRFDAVRCPAECCLSGRVRGLRLAIC